MSETDIYKRGDLRDTGRSTHPKFEKRRRRRSASSRVFDDQGRPRERRSKNSGLRRLLHLMRKPENEKQVWWTVLVVSLLILGIVAIWQFWYRESVARQQMIEMEKGR